MEILVIILYLLPTCVLFLYSCAQLSLVWNYWRHQKSGNGFAQRSFSSWPLVCVQLPIYNERYVIERLIDAVCAFNYPKNCLEIQILDDSNDETVELVARKIAHYQRLGFRIAHIRRA